MSVNVAATPGRRWGRLGSGLLCAAGGAAVALAIVALASHWGAATAFPGWQAIPGFTSPDQYSKFNPAACGAASAAAHRGHFGKVVIRDSRGTYTSAVYTGSHGVPSDTSVCLSDNSSDPGGLIPASLCTSGSLALSAIPANRIETHGILQTCAMEGPTGVSAATFARGRVGPGVVGVTIRRSGGGLVQATVADGWFLAWWPGTSLQAVAVMTTTSSNASPWYVN